MNFVPYPELIEFINRIYLQLHPEKKGQHMAISISQEIEGIQTAVTALQAQVANPPAPVDSLTPSTQAQLDALATSLNAPTSTSTSPASS